MYCFSILIRSHTQNKIQSVVHPHIVRILLCQLCFVVPRNRLLADDRFDISCNSGSTQRANMVFYAIYDPMTDNGKNFTFSSKDVLLGISTVCDDYAGTIEHNIVCNFSCMHILVVCKI